MRFDSDIKIVGVDASPVGAGKHFVDAFVEVPFANNPNYIERISQICNDYDINHIIPTNDNELIPLAKNKREFELDGIEIFCSDYKTIRSAGNKRLMLSELESNGVNHPSFYIPNSIDEFKLMARDLGYPERPIVVKPESGRGSRGVKIVSSEVDYKSVIFEEKPSSPYIDMETLLHIISNSNSEFPDLVLMEYLPGKEYSVDILIEKSEPKFVVPKQRIAVEPGHSLINKVDLNDEILDYVTKICEVFEFEYVINMQFKYSVNDKPQIYEINPRVAASIQFSKLAGANLIRRMISNAEGSYYGDIEIVNGTRCLRYLESISSYNED